MPALAAALALEVWDYPRIPDPRDATDRFSWLETILRGFEKANPGVSVRLTRLAWGAGEDKIKISVLAGRPPDVSSGPLPLGFVNLGAVVPVDGALAADDLRDYDAGALEAFRFGGHTYGFPFAQRTDVLLANLDLWRARGLEPPTGETWLLDDFLASARRLTHASKAGGPIDRFGFAFAPERGKSPFRSLLRSLGSESLDSAGRFSLDAAPSLAALETLRSLVEVEKVTPPDVAGFTEDHVWNGFGVARSIATAPLGLWAIAKLERDRTFPIAVLPFPTRPGIVPSPVAAVTGYFVFRHADAERTRLALALARAITSGENQRALVRYGQFPTRASAGDLYADHPALARARALARTARPLPVHPAWDKIDEAEMSGLSPFLLGRSSLDAALVPIRARVRAILAENAPAPDERTPPGFRCVSYPVRGWYVVPLVILGHVIGFALFGRTRRGRAVWAAMRANPAPYFFLAPALVLLGTFFFLPILRVFLLAHQRFEVGMEPFQNFCGFENYARVLSDPALRGALTNTAIYTLIAVPANLLSALVLAALIHPLSIRASRIFRAAYYLPGVASTVVLAMIWKGLFDPTRGFANGILAHLGFAPVPWLTSPDLALYSIALVAILRGPGGGLLVYLAALASIPKDLDESAMIDGAGPFTRFFRITLPLLAPTTLFLAITYTIDSFQVFAPVLLLTDGGPGNASTVLVHRIYTAAFRDLELGPASALSLLLMAFLVLIARLQFRTLGNEEVAS